MVETTGGAQTVATVRVCAIRRNFARLGETIAWLESQEVTCLGDLVGASDLSQWEGASAMSLEVIQFLNNLVQVRSVMRALWHRCKHFVHRP